MYSIFAIKKPAQCWLDMELVACAPSPEPYLSLIRLQPSGVAFAVRLHERLNRWLRTPAKNHDVKPLWLIVYSYTTLVCWAAKKPCCQISVSVHTNTCFHSIKSFIRLKNLAIPVRAKGAAHTPSHLLNLHRLLFDKGSPHNLLPSFKRFFNRGLVCISRYFDSHKIRIKIVNLGGHLNAGAFFAD